MFGVFRTLRFCFHSTQFKTVFLVYCKQSGTAGCTKSAIKPSIFVPELDDLQTLLFFWLLQKSGTHPLYHFQPSQMYFSSILTQVLFWLYSGFGWLVRWLVAWLVGWLVGRSTPSQPRFLIDTYTSQNSTGEDDRSSCPRIINLIT